MNKKSSLLAKGLSLSALTLLSRILGLIREMTKARFLGTSALSDAFGIAFMIPNLFRRLFAENSVSVAFIPTFKNYLEDSTTPEKKNETQDFISATFTLLTFLTTVFVSIGMILTPLILRIFYKTEDSAAMKEAEILTRIMFPYLAVISVAALFQGILNALKIFSPSGFTPILFNSIVIASTYILSRWTENPARAMAIGVILGGSVQAFFQFPFVLKNDWKVTFTSLKKAFSNPGTRKVIRLVGPTIIGMAGYQINDIVSSALATRAGEGVVSSLQYSLRLQELILGICAVTIGTVILPDLTGFAKNRMWEEFKNLISQSVKIMALIAIPITFYALIMSENIICLIFSGGKFKEESVRMTMDVFNWHIIGLFFIAVNIALASLLVTNFGGKGIAFALTTASAVNTIILFAFLSKTKDIQVGDLVKSIVTYSLKIILLSIAASASIYFIKDRIIAMFEGHSKLISHGIPVAITGIIFGTAGIILLALTKDSVLKAASRKIIKRA